MTFGLDYDGTFDADPLLFATLAADIDRHGHQVFLVTQRKSAEGADVTEAVKATAITRVIFTEGHAKKPFVEAMGLHIDVWIDDKPKGIFKDKKGCK